MIAIRSPRAVSVILRARPTGSVIKISLRRFLVWFLVSLYPILLVISLREVISPAFSYAGYLYTPPDQAWAPVTLWLLSVIPGLFIPVSDYRPAVSILWILYFIVYVPIVALPVYASGRDVPSFLPFQIAVMTGFLIALFLGTREPIPLPTISLHPWIYLTIIASISLSTYLLVVIKYGLPTEIPSLTQVYDVRSDFGEDSAGQSRLEAYLINWQGKVVNPLIMAIGLTQRKATALAVGVLGQILLFSLAGHRSVLFSTILILGLYLAYKDRGKRLGSLITVGVFAVILGSIAVDRLVSAIIWSSIFIRRLIMTPGVMTGYYEQFFSENPKTMSLGPLSFLFGDYPYDVTVPFLIGREVLNEHMSANANLWAGGYASFGYAGVILMSIILGTILMAFNSLALRKRPMFVAIVAGAAAFSLVNSSLPTSLGSHGILFALLLLACSPRTRSESDVATGGPGLTAPSGKRAGQSKRRERFHGGAA